MKTKKVLVVDDSKLLHRMFEMMLRGFPLVHAFDGREALDRLAEHKDVEIILLDINMPRKNGLEVCRELKSQPETADIKIVMLTASGSDADKAGARDAQADDYFVKPFSPVALLNKIYELLG